ncbi:unnamed protein product [Pseudo-nitzschia multistriata]|uniref:Uncharacterized protein n=1 Tax=Pseudo-nitzschia multistriata TaxID=183589 RepID=A0A448Z2U2_9STRA|nr:unnamed protein product [Pseudo-nitzschia multistriata]
MQPPPAAAAADDAVPHAADPTEAQQALAFDKTTEKGAEKGLFRACMASIRSAHVSANRLRAALVLSGLFTDRKVYREAIALFYLATDALEKKIAALHETEGDEICGKLLSLGYRFGPLYERDLLHLYGRGWRAAVEAVAAGATDGAGAYLRAIEDMASGAELAGAAFCLWGALVIGGGAAAGPRVESLCGKGACHLFGPVTGPGRGERKKRFVALWDGLAVPCESGSGGNDGAGKDNDNDNDESFDRIVAASKDCMQGNNELIVSVRRNPWWLKYVASVGVAVVAFGLSCLHRGGGPGGKP